MVEVLELDPECALAQAVAHEQDQGAAIAMQILRVRAEREDLLTHRLVEGRPVDPSSSAA